MRAKHPFPRNWLLAAILGLALALRLWGIGDRLPDPTLGIRLVDDSAVEETDRTTMERAWAMWRGGASRLDLNPRTAGWPGLPFYVTLGIQVTYAALYGLAKGGDFLALARTFPTSAPGLFLFARLFSVVIGTLSVYLTYRLAARIASSFVAVSAAFLLAVNALHTLTSQHVSDPNLLTLTFTLLAANSLIDVWERQRMRDSILAGVFIGSAAASKYVPIVLLIPFVYAHARRSVGGAERASRSTVLRLIAGSAAIIAVFLVASPYSVLDWQTTAQDLVGQRQSLFSPWAGQTEGVIALPTYLTRTLPSVLSWPGYVLAVLGIALLLRSGRSQRIVACVPIVLLLANGMLSVAQGRYVLPAVPFLLIGTAAAIESGWHMIRVRMPLVRYSAALPVIIVLLCALGPAKSLAEIRQSMRLPDSRRMARRWINTSIEPTEPVALDLYGPVVNSDQQERIAIVWPLRVSGSSRVQAAYYPQWLDGLRFYVVSSEVSRRFGANTPESQFYSWIRGNSTQVWRSDRAHASGPEIAVYKLPPNISSRSTRDSLWTIVRAGDINADRLARWSADMATLFLYRGEWSRVEEWALRGLSLEQESLRENLLETLIFARLQLGRNADAERTATEALRRNPQNYQFHLYRGMALDSMGRSADAILEYRKSLSLTPNQERNQEIESRIRTLERR